MYLAIDFDGTVADHLFPDIGDEVPRAFYWLKKFQEAGAKLILLTMRSDGRLEHGNVLSNAVAFCRERGVEFWAVNDNPECGWSTSRKVYAHIYVDDAAACCPLCENPRHGGRPYVDWDVVGPWVMSRLVAA